jgi:molecular chaperone GrpE
VKDDLMTTEQSDGQQGGGNGVGEEAASAAPGTPEERVAALEAEKKDVQERLLRIAAEFDNYKKRVRKDLQDAEIKAREGVLKDALEIMDNLERAVASLGEAASADAVRQGVALVLRLFQSKLERYDVKPVDAKGKPFDPRVHEAIGRVTTAEVAPGLVANERQRGYTIGDRLLRPALVEVAVAPEQPAPQGAA